MVLPGGAQVIAHVGDQGEGVVRYSIAPALLRLAQNDERLPELGLRFVRSPAYLRHTVARTQGA